MKNKPLVIPIFIPHSGCPHQCAFCNQSIITERESVITNKRTWPDLPTPNNELATTNNENETVYFHGRDKTTDHYNSSKTINSTEAIKTPEEIEITDKFEVTYRSSEAAIPSKSKIRQEVERFLSYKGSREEVQLAFFGGNFLGLETDQIDLLLSTAQELADENKINSIRFSTRPDTITKEKLELIAPYPVSTIEIGVQSMNDTVLKMARRGHTAEDTINAVSLLREYSNKRYSRSRDRDYPNSAEIYQQKPVIKMLQWNIGQISLQKNMRSLQTGIQMMVGLPGDSDKTAIETAYKIAGLNPDFVRIYPLIVLEGSLLARWYREGRYTPPSLDSCVELVKKIYLIFQNHNIPVIRMGLQASDLLQDKLSMLAGPWHPAFGHLVYSKIFFDTALNLINKEISFKNMDDNQSNTITLTVHPSSLSRLKGDKNLNMKRLGHIYPSVEFKIKPDDSLDKSALKILHPVTNSKV
ncbi:MAG: radical SAM protein [Desulfamplus sp.]|nr:radical SAM protein [Desulfamplus sp.]